MDQSFFNVGLSASLWLSTRPRFASHPATICWPLWTVQGQGKLRLFPGRFQPPPAWYGQSFAGQAAAPAKLLLHLGWSSAGRRDWEASPKSLGLTKIGNKGDLSQPKLTRRTHMVQLTADLHREMTPAEREGWKCSGRTSWWFGLPLGILEWIDAVGSRGGWALWRSKGLAEGMDRVITGYKPPSPELFTETKDSITIWFTGQP